MPTNFDAVLMLIGCRLGYIVRSQMGKGQVEEPEEPDEPNSGSGM